MLEGIIHAHLATPSLLPFLNPFFALKKTVNVAIEYFKSVLTSCITAIDGAWRASRLYQILSGQSRSSPLLQQDTVLSHPQLAVQMEEQDEMGVTKQSIAQLFKERCSNLLQQYTYQSAMLSQHLQQRLAENMAEKDEKGVTKQFCIDVKRRSVSFSLGRGAATFSFEKGGDKVTRAIAMIKANCSDDLKWVALTQSVVTQTTANETGLNAVIGSLNALSAEPPFSDDTASHIRYSFDVDVPTNTITPEKSQDGTMLALNVSCHSVSCAVKRDLSKDASEERLHFSLAFRSSYRVTLDAKGQLLVSDLKCSVKIIDTPLPSKRAKRLGSNHLKNLSRRAYVIIRGARSGK